MRIRAPFQCGRAPIRAGAGGAVPVSRATFPVTVKGRWGSAGCVQSASKGGGPTRLSKNGIDAIDDCGDGDGLCTRHQLPNTAVQQDAEQDRKRSGGGT